MRKLSLLVLTLVMMAGFNGVCAQDILLPPPQKSNQQASLMDALQNRHSTRAYSEKMVSNQLLSDLLWAANGINRADGKRTAPSAINSQDIELYVYKKDVGTYHYLPAGNKLAKVSDADIRPLIIARNAFVNIVPYVVVLVSNQAKYNGMKSAYKLGAMDAGYVSQNIYLFCSAYGLSTVACAPPMDAAAIQKVLGLPAEFMPLIYHPVGFAKE